MNVTVADFRRTLVAVGRVGWRNLVGLLVVTVAVWATFLPLLTTVAIGAPVAVLGGLWTTCLLLGVALLVVFRFTSTAVERGVGVPVVPSFRSVRGRAAVGMGLGAVTFGVVVATLALVGVAPDQYRGIAAGVGGFILVFWYVLVGLASPELGTGSGLRPALRAAGARFARSPVLAAWFVVLSILVSLAAGATLVTLVLFLPGVLGLLAMQVATDVATVEEVSAVATARNGE